MADPAILKVYKIGSLGVNIDIDPLSIDDMELRLAQNAIRDPLGSDSGLRKRPGLLAYNGAILAGSILGGIGVPLQDLSVNSTQIIYIGRGPF